MGQDIGTHVTQHPEKVAEAVESLQQVHQLMREGKHEAAATALAEAFGRGTLQELEGSSYLQEMRGDQELERSFFEQVGKGDGAHFAADAVSGMFKALDGNHFGEGLRASAKDITRNAVRGFQTGLVQAEADAAHAIPEYKRDASMIAGLVKEHTPTLGADEAGRIGNEMMADRTDLMRNSEQSAGRLFDAIDAGTRLLDEHPRGPVDMDVFRNKMKHATSRLPDVAQTFAGRARFEENLDRQAAGERTVFDRVADLPRVLPTGDSRRRVFDALATTASQRGMRAYLDQDPAAFRQTADLLDKNAQALLDRDGQRLVGMATDAMRADGSVTAEDAQRIATSLRIGEGDLNGRRPAEQLSALAGLRVGDSVEDALSQGAPVDKLKGVFGESRDTFRDIPIAGSYLARGERILKGQETTGDIAGTLYDLSDLAQGGALVTRGGLKATLQGASDKLGNVGNVLMLADALHKGREKEGMIAAASLVNPYLGLGLTALDLGAQGYKLVDDTLHQRSLGKEFLSLR